MEALTTVTIMLILNPLKIIDGIALMTIQCEKLIFKKLDRKRLEERLVLMLMYSTIN